MKYVSLFAGIGGFDLALNRLGHECVYANDFDKYAKITYDKNFSHKLDTRSITDVEAESIPAHDLLVGGFPCQAFSIAGRRRGFEEARGTLFFDVARILKHHKTKYFILENVKGLLSHDSGRTFRVIIKTLTELRYDLQWQVLNSKNFGVPQNRERVYIVGHFRGQPRPEVFPIGADNSEASKVRYQNSNIRGHSGNGQSKNGRATERREISNPLQGNSPYGWHFEQNVYSESSLVRSLKAGEGSGNKPKVMQDMSIRRLTPVECERLQGFPDGWTEGVSDTQRYKQLGNAVTVNVVEAVASKL